MKITDDERGTEITIEDYLDMDHEVQLVGDSNKGDVIWFYMNKEQAYDVVRHLSRIFDFQSEG